VYGKIFDSIFKSTLVSVGGWLPTYIFMSMITLADKDGIVDFALKALYSHLGFREYDSKISFDDFKQAVEYLEQEDEESNSPDENGRRIVPLKEIETMDENRGWLVVNYANYSKKASKHDEREATANRVRRYRDRKRNESVTDCNGKKRNDNGKKGHIDIDIDVDIDKRKTFMSDSDEYRLAELLWKHIQRNNPNAKKPNLQSWSKAMDSILRIDKRSVDSCKELIRWCQKDSFWMTNILSPKKLRKHWDRLTLKMRSEKKTEEPASQAHKEWVDPYAQQAGE
jgi:hypothetical protein